MEWINDGAHRVQDGEWRVLWRPAGDSGARVVSRFFVVGTPKGRAYRVAAETLFELGVWTHVEVGAGSAEVYRTRREAATWAHRMAEMEAANRSAVAWDGRVPA